MEKNDSVKRASSVLHEISGDEEARRIAFLREKAIRDEINNINGARREGKEEKAIEIAKKLKEMNMSDEDIRKATGLSNEEIEKL